MLLQVNTWAQLTHQLVRAGEHETDLDIVPTFSSGTILVTRNTQRGRDDLAGVYGSLPDSGVSEAESESAGASGSSSKSGSESEAEAGAGVSEPPLNQASLSRTASGPSGRGRGATTYPIPLAALNMFETAWLGDKYGVWDRKQYAKDWWKTLDWARIDSRNALGR